MIFKVDWYEGEAGLLYTCDQGIIKSVVIPDNDEHPIPIHNFFDGTLYGAINKKTSAILL